MLRRIYVYISDKSYAMSKTVPLVWLLLNIKMEFGPLEDFHLIPFIYSNWTKFQVIGYVYICAL